MNYAIIFRLLSVIMAALALAFALSLGVGLLHHGDPRERGAALGFGLSVALAAALAAIFWLLSRRGDHKMFRKEALCAVGLGWTLASLVGAAPYLLVLGCSPADALFESTSGLTTTGATVLSNLEQLPRSLLFWRAVSQWIGGMGVVVFFVAVLSFVGAGAKILFTSESSVQVSDLDSGRVVGGVLQILYLYLALSVSCAAAFFLCGMSLYDAVCHMFTTVSTGGFSTYSDSVRYFRNSTLEWVFILFMVLGGLSFPVMLRLVRGDWRTAARNTETLAYAVVLLTGSVLVAAHLLTHWERLGYDQTYEAADAFRLAAFQVTSIVTTSGFSSEDFAAWPHATHSILIVLMIVGGCAGSTAGGLKIIRLVIGLKVCRLNIERAFRARVVRPLRVNRRQVADEDRDNVIQFFLLTVLLYHIALLVVASLQPDLSFESVDSAVLSCLFNIGPGLAEVGPYVPDAYAQFSDGSKVILSLLMIMGRLELYAVLALFFPSLWRRFA